MVLGWKLCQWGYLDKKKETLDEVTHEVLVFPFFILFFSSSSRTMIPTIRRKFTNKPSRTFTTLFISFRSSYYLLGDPNVVASIPYPQAATMIQLAQPGHGVLRLQLCTSSFVTKIRQRHQDIVLFLLVAARSALRFVVVVSAVAGAPATADAVVAAVVDDNTALLISADVDDEDATSSGLSWGDELVGFVSSKLLYCNVCRRLLLARVIEEVESRELAGRRRSVSEVVRGTVVVVCASLPDAAGAVIDAGSSVMLMLARLCDPEISFAIAAEDALCAGGGSLTESALTVSASPSVMCLDGSPLDCRSRRGLVGSVCFALCGVGLERSFLESMTVRTCITFSDVVVVFFDAPVCWTPSFATPTASTSVSLGRLNLLTRLGSA